MPRGLYFVPPGNTLALPPSCTESLSEILIREIQACQIEKFVLSDLISLLSVLPTLPFGMDLLNLPAEVLQRALLHSSTL